MAAGIPVEMMSNSTLPLGFLHSSIAGHELTSFYIFRYLGNVNSAEDALYSFKENVALISLC